jgi:hypothetical protein
MRALLRWSTAAAVATAVAFAAVPARADDVADQIATLGKGMDQALERYRPKWTKHERTQYVNACEEALKDHLVDPLTSEEMDLLLAGERNWVRESLPPRFAEENGRYYLDALDYAVSQMFERRHLRPTDAKQKEIDRQIDLFCDWLKPALIQHFAKYSKKEDLNQAAESIRASFKRSSRNPWFPALKEPLDAKEEAEVGEMIEQTLAQQQRSFEERKAAGKEFSFDWGVTSAWSAATKFVSKTITPPSDRMLLITHSPTLPGIAIQIKPPMIAPH